MVPKMVSNVSQPKGKQELNPLGFQAEQLALAASVLSSPVELEMQDWMFVCRWGGVDQTEREVSWGHTVCNDIKVKVNYSSRAVLAVARGNQDNSFIASSVLKKLQQSHRCVQWNPFPVDHWTDPRNEIGISSSSRLLTVCSNHSSVTKLLGHVVHRARDMLDARAYLHWYECYGVEAEQFQHALNTLTGVIEEYDSQ